MRSVEKFLNGRVEGFGLRPDNSRGQKETVAAETPHRANGGAGEEAIPFGFAQDYKIEFEEEVCFRHAVRRGGFFIWCWRW